MKVLPGFGPARGSIARAAVAVTASAVAAMAVGLPGAQAAPAPGWRLFHTIGVPNTSLGDVTATGTSDAWAAGSSAAQRPVLYHWNGRQWVAIARPGSQGTFAASVAASSASNVWAVIANAGAVDHWNGHTWSRTTFGSPLSALGGAVATTGPANTWVFTYNQTTGVEKAHHYNGRSWSTTTLPATVDGGSTAGLVSASSAANIWAFGVAHSAWVTTHFNGKTWQTAPLPANLVPAGNQMLPEQMLAESPTSVWATVLSISSSSAGPAVLLHWNGQRWSRVTAGIPAAALLGPVASDGHGGLWLYAETPTYIPFLAHYLSGKWTRAAVPAAPQGSVSITSLALIPGTRTLWGVGAVGAAFNTSKGAAILGYGH
jgi:hypothetical protein